MPDGRASFAFPRPSHTKPTMASDTLLVTSTMTTSESGGAAATSTIGTITPLLRATSPAVSIVTAAALVLVVKTTCDVTAAPASRCAATTDVISTATAQA